MKVSILLPIVTVLLALSPGCELVGPDEVENDLPNLTAAEKGRVAVSNSFGFELMRGLVPISDEPNVIVSPLSVSFALGMTLNGAAGTTRNELAEMLDLEGLSEKEINEAYHTLLEILPALDPSVAIELANAIWYREGFEVETSFLDANRQYFDAEVSALAFDEPEAVDAINDWIADKTHEHIRDVIDRIDPATVMFLVNALYFNAPWKVAFDPDQTVDGPFQLADGTSKTVRMMAVRSRFATYRGSEYRAIDVPYGDSLFALTVLIPDDPGGLAGLVETLTAAEWDRLLDGLRSDSVTLHLPRFEGSYGTSLEDVLTSLGMVRAFDPAQADLTRINPAGGLWVEDVIHKTTVEWNEEGTEASAVTVVIIGRTSTDESVFRVDRPFVFAIRERHTRTVLFLGAVTNP